MVFSSPTILTYETVRFRLPGYKPHPESPAVGCQMRFETFTEGVWDCGISGCSVRRYETPFTPVDSRPKTNHCQHCPDPQRCHLSLLPTAPHKRGLNANRHLGCGLDPAEKLLDRVASIRCCKEIDPHF